MVVPAVSVAIFAKAVFCKFEVTHSGTDEYVQTARALTVHISTATLRLICVFMTRGSICVDMTALAKAYRGLYDLHQRRPLYGAHQQC